jgi:acyl phosphate:glycerol-3-phosphate acyltransferase
VLPIAALLLILSYLIGSIPTGVIVGRLSGFDPRAVGSGNIGMANVARAGGTRAAAITFLGDMLKGLIPVLAVRVAGFDPGVVVACALAAFVGSISSVFLRFSGGKGVACAVGIWTAISPLAVGIALLVFLGVFSIWRIMSLSSLSAAIVLPPLAAALSLASPYVLLAILMTALILLRHQENIGRLIRGEEPTFGPHRRDQRLT